MRRARQLAHASAVRRQVADLGVALAHRRRRLGLERLGVGRRPLRRRVGRRPAPRPPAARPRRPRTRRAWAAAPAARARPARSGRPPPTGPPPPTRNARSHRHPGRDQRVQRVGEPAQQPLDRGPGQVRRRRAWPGVSPCSAPVASGRFGVRSPSRYGTSTSPSAPGRRGQRQPGQLGVVDAEHARGRVQHPGRVERADQRQVLAGGRGEAGDDAGRRRRSAWCSPPRPRPRCPSETTTSPGAGARARARRRRCRPAPGPSRTPSGVRPAASAGPSTRGSRTSSRPKARSSRSQPVLAGDAGEVAGAAGVAAVGDQVVQRRRCRAASRSASRAAGTPRRSPPRAPARASASQRSLVAVNEATGHAADGLGPLLARPARPRGRRPPAPSGCRSTAAPGRTTSPVGVQAHHPVLLPGHRDARPHRTARRPASIAACRASHQAAGSTSVPGGCGARPCRTSAPVSASRITTVHDCVDESTPGRPASDSRRSAAPPIRCSTASWSSRT